MSSFFDNTLIWSNPFGTELVDPSRSPFNTLMLGNPGDGWILATGFWDDTAGWGASYVWID